MRRAPGPVRAVLLAATCAALEGCDPVAWGITSPPTPHKAALAIDAVAYRVEGRYQLFRAPPTPELDDVALRDQASRDLGCPAKELRTTVHQALAIYRVEGCGKTDVYLRVAGRRQPKALAIVAQRDVWIDAVGFLSLTRGDVAAASSLFAGVLPKEDASDLDAQDVWTYLVPSMGSAKARPDGTAPGVASVIARWVDLLRLGARDVKCPENEVVVDLRSIGRQQLPVAEGCGRRATYIAGREGKGFDLAAVVDMPAAAAVR